MSDRTPELDGSFSIIRYHISSLDAFSSPKTSSTGEIAPICSIPRARQLTWHLRTSPESSRNHSAIDSSESIPSEIPDADSFDMTCTFHLFVQIPIITFLKIELF